MAYVNEGGGLHDLEALGRRGGVFRRRRAAPPPPPPPPPPAEEAPEPAAEPSAEGLSARRIGRTFGRVARFTPWGVAYGAGRRLVRGRRPAARGGFGPGKPSGEMILAKKSAAKNPVYVGYLKAYVGQQGLADMLGPDGLRDMEEGLAKGKRSLIPKKIRKTGVGKYITKHRRALLAVTGIIAGIAGAVVFGPAIIAGAGKILGLGSKGVTSALNVANRARAAAGLGPLSPTDLANRMKKRAQDRAAAGLPAETPEQAAAAVAPDAAPVQANEVVTPAAAEAQIQTAVKSGAITSAQGTQIGQATSETVMVGTAGQAASVGAPMPEAAGTSEAEGGTPAPKKAGLFGLPKPVVYAGGAVAATVIVLSLIRRKR